MTNATEKNVLYINSSDLTGPGEVRMAGDVKGFRLRCTVPGCGWTAKGRNYAIAQRIAFDHGAYHQFG